MRTITLALMGLSLAVASSACRGKDVPASTTQTTGTEVPGPMNEGVAAPPVQEGTTSAATPPTSDLQERPASLPAESMANDGTISGGTMPSHSMAADPADRADGTTPAPPATRAKDRTRSVGTGRMIGQNGSSFEASGGSSGLGIVGQKDVPGQHLWRIGGHAKGDAGR